MADAGRIHRHRGLLHHRTPSTEPSPSQRDKLSNFLHRHPNPVHLHRSNPEECSSPVSTSQSEGHHVRHYFVKSAASTSSHGFFRFLGHDFDSETDKILKEYYELDPFATIKLDCIKHASAHIRPRRIVWSHTFVFYLLYFFCSLNGLHFFSGLCHFISSLLGLL
eukprot:EG_transcript_38048